MLGFTFWLTYDVVGWAKVFGATSTLDGMGTAAVIAAVTAPVSGLMGWVFKIYSARKNVLTENEYVE